MACHSSSAPTCFMMCHVLQWNHRRGTQNLTRCVFLINSSINIHWKLNTATQVWMLQINYNSLVQVNGFVCGQSFNMLFSVLLHNYLFLPSSAGCHWCKVLVCGSLFCLSTAKYSNNCCPHSLKLYCASGHSLFVIIRPKHSRICEISKNVTVHYSVFCLWKTLR